MFNSTPHEVGTKFKNIRTANGKYRKKLKSTCSRSKVEGVPPPNELKNVEWLRNHISTRQTSSNLKADSAVWCSWKAKKILKAFWTIGMIEWTWLGDCSAITATDCFWTITAIVSIKWALALYDAIGKFRCYDWTCLFNFGPHSSWITTV